MTTWRDSNNVAMTQAARAAYPAAPPFHPSSRHAELSFLPAFTPDPDNAVYDAVRNTLCLLGGDPANPLGILVRPGNSVVLKPNFIRECHETKPREWQQVITHGAVIRAVCDYVLLALRGEGRVIICDAPQSDSSFDAICRVSGAKAVVDWYATWSPVPVDLLDLRAEEWVVRDGVIISRRKIKGDPKGYVAVNLGRASEFARVQPRHGFYGADYDMDETRRHHHDDVHEYLLSATVMQADVVINLPKLKTHKKTGITCALKNLVGINGDKNWLPHYMMGGPEEGGDQFDVSTPKTRSEQTFVSRIKKLLLSAPPWVNHLFRPIRKCSGIFLGSTHKVVRSGNWHGNDTTWRMVADLNKCFFYGQQGFRVQGSGEESASSIQLQSAINNHQSAITNPRRYIALVDGIIAGEGEGPLAPDAKPCGVLVAGMNPVAVDAACAWLMGFDMTKLKLLTGTSTSGEMPLRAFGLEEIKVASNKHEWQGNLASLDPKTAFKFEPHFGWKGSVERQ